MERDKYKGKQSINTVSPKGITLVALVITIIIIIILSTIAINFTFGENGLITRAEQAKELAEVSTIQEQMEMIKAEELIEGQGTIDPDRYFDKLEQSGVILDKDTDVIDNGDGTYEVTADPDYVFDVTAVPDKENPTDLEIEYVGKGEVIGPRIRKINILEQTENSISVEVLTRDAEGGTYTYSYRKEGEQSWIDAATNNSNTYVYEGLEASTTYEIKVKVETAEGVTEKETKVTLGAPEVAPEGTITFGEVTWSGYKASVTVNTSAEGYTIEYQVNKQDEGSWQTVDNGGIIPNLNHGDTVYARITNENTTSGTQEKEIADTKSPTVVVNANGTTSSSVSVTVQAVDNESGMKEDATYTYSIKETSQGDETYTTPEDANGITNTSYTFTGLTQGTNYTVRVQVNGDKANNVGTGTLADQITGNIPSGGDSGVEQGAITFGSVTWNEGQASIIISTNEEGYSIEYQINDTQEGQWKAVPSNGQVTGLSHGDAVFARLTDGTNHGDYASTNIQDGVVPQKASIEPNTTNLVAGETLTATVTHVDNESGVEISESKWILNTTATELGTEDTSAYTGTFTANGEQITLNSNTTGTYYLHVLTVDKAGNKTETVSDPITITTITTGTITQKGEATWSSGTASIELETTSNYEIEYKVNDGSWTKYTGAITGLNHGDTVTARLTNNVTTGQETTFQIKDETNPTVTVSPGGTTTNSVSVTASATDSQSGMKDSLTYTYSIKVTSQGDETYNTPSNAQNIALNSYTFTGLTQGTNYTVRVQVNGDKANNVGTGTLEGQITKNVPGATGGLATGNIIATNPTWSSGTASITLTTSTGLQIQHQVNSTSGQWTTIASGGSVTGLSHGDTVFARLYDGTNYGDYASVNILDGMPPTVTVNPGGTTTNSVSVTASATDAQSGMKDSLTYTYSIKTTGQDDSTYNTPSNAQNIASNSYTFTGLTQGTNYTVRVQVNGDKANNVGTGTLANQTTGTVGGATGGLATGNIVATDPTWSNGTASITLTTSVSGMQIEWQKNVITGSWTKIDSGGQVTGLSHGDTVFARLTDGTNVGDYASVNILDGTPPSITNMTTSDITASSATVTVTASDTESGLATSGTYKYYLNSESSPRGTNTTGSYTFTGLSAETGYTLKVVVTDKAGNEAEDTRSVTTEKLDPTEQIATPIANVSRGDEFDETTKVSDTSGDIFYVPGGFGIASDSATDADDGIVITNSNNTKQFVWIPVDSTSLNEMYQSASGTKLTGVTTTTNVYSKLRQGTSSIGGAPGSTTYREPDVLSSRDTSSTYYSILGYASTQAMADAMVAEYTATYNSIQKYKGFYIGRYELTGSVSSPTVRKGQTVLTDQNWYNLKKACSNVVSSSYAQSTMIYGNQWDEVMDWIVDTGAKTSSQVNEDSASWGNYSDSTGAATTNSGSKQTSGKNEAWQANNIYDLAGNCFEWTQEANVTVVRILHGGAYHVSGSDYPASDRLGYDATYSNSNVSSRPALYVK